MTKKRIRKGTIEIIGGVLLIAAALFLTAKNICEARQAGMNSDGVLAQLTEARSEDAGALMLSKAPTATESPEPESETVYPDYVLNPNMDMPVKTVDGMDYIATLSIPALGLELPVAKEWDYEKLRVSPCRYLGSAYLNNLVIAAHNYKAHFGRLYTLSKGDSVNIADMDGNIFHYEVAEVTTLPSTAVEEMTGSGYDLSLFTCMAGGYARVTVRCVRAD